MLRLVMVAPIPKLAPVMMGTRPRKSDFDRSAEPKLYFGCFSIMPPQKGICEFRKL
jgi:hypothetical protein